MARLRCGAVSVPRNFRRNEMPVGIPSLAMEDGVKYLHIQHEDRLKLKARAKDIAKEAIAAEIKKRR